MPGTTIARKTADGAERAQADVLHYILGVGAVARDPARQRVGIAEMRQHCAPETRIVIV
jgi:hypothetical protein